MSNVAGNSVRRIKDGGFEKTGTWQHGENGIPYCKPCRGKKLPPEPGVYIFVQGNRIRYVGSAQLGIAQRIRSYERSQLKGAENRNVHRAITENVRTGRVHVYTLVIEPANQRNPEGLPVNQIVGLEKGLIDEFDPNWNWRLDALGQPIPPRRRAVQASA